jgi:hypothetical protein
MEIKFIEVKVKIKNLIKIKVITLIIKHIHKINSQKYHLPFIKIVPTHHYGTIRTLFLEINREKGNKEKDNYHSRNIRLL